MRLRTLIAGIGILFVGAIMLQAQLTAPAAAKDDAQKNQALSLATKEYEKKYGGMSDTEMPSLSSFHVGFSIPDFADSGDEIWDVRFMSISQALMLEFWVNRGTKKAMLVMGRPAPESTPEQAAAKSLASIWWEHNAAKSDGTLRFQSTEMTLAYDVPNLAKRGEKIMEVHVSNKEGVVGVIWVNIMNRMVLPVTGSWESGGTVKAAATRL
jgi:hypothetical protein